MIQPFSLCEGKYTTSGKTIGYGAFATVLEGQMQSGAKVALKLLKLDWETDNKKASAIQRQLEAEIKILRDTNHPNVVRLFDTDRHPSTGQLCLVMEFCSEGDLEKYLLKKGGILGEPETKYFLKQLAAGLGHLRNKGIIHRDLKPENLLLKVRDDRAGELELKIADFGLARVLESIKPTLQLSNETGPGQMAQTQCGTRYYMAPEIYLGQNYTYKADLWSVGVIIFRLVTGKTLFSQPPTYTVLSDANHTFFDEQQYAQTMSKDLRSLLSELLQKNPNERISFEEFSMHPFLNEKDDNYVDTELEGSESKITSPKLCKSKTLPRKSSRKSTENPRSPRIRGPIVDDFLSTSRSLPEVYQNNLAILRKFPSPSHDSITTLLISPGSPGKHFVLRGRFSMTLSIIGEQMETEESFILHFRGLQILHEMICSNEYLGGDRSQLEVEIREVMDAALQIQSQMSHDASTPIFFTMILKQGYRAANLEKQGHFSDAMEEYNLAIWFLEFLDLWNGAHTKQQNTTVREYLKAFRARSEWVESRARP